MNCEELKKALDTKDQEVQARKENTIRCFELVKDFCLDKVIKETIDKEFKESVYLYEGEVYGNLLNKIGIDVSCLSYDFAICMYRTGKQDINYKFKTGGVNHISTCEDYLNYIDQIVKKEIEQYQKVEEFKEKFDHVLFWKMIDNHILSNGFKHEYNRNDFYVITRRKLERICCGGKIEEDRDDTPLQLKLISFGLIVIILLFLWGLI